MTIHVVFMILILVSSNWKYINLRLFLQFRRASETWIAYNIKNNSIPQSRQDHKAFTAKGIPFVLFVTLWEIIQTETSEIYPFQAIQMIPQLENKESIQHQLYKCSLHYSHLGNTLILSIRLRKKLSRPTTSSSCSMFLILRPLFCELQHISRLIIQYSANRYECAKSYYMNFSKVLGMWVLDL